jgi:hypothetical protein
MMPQFDHCIDQIKLHQNNSGDCIVVFMTWNQIVANDDMGIVSNLVTLDLMENTIEALITSNFIKTITDNNRTTITRTARTTITAVVNPGPGTTTTT